MGNTPSRDMFNVYAVNTPLVGVCAVSCMFNSVLNGTLRISNVYTNMVLCLILGCSNGATGPLHMPVLGAQLGFAGGLLFTLGAPLRILFTSRLFPRSIHYGIGTFYTTYHAMQWYKELHYFEDAGEDGDGDVF
ncbi:hypothetical protein NESM_000029000 [Novymonas esmeraldas]|uniref:Uncharacterized protein n=1 Tax=Novymonas esmeraldas TaxID=1808958 RepID=A0AAW0F2I0_9TRYP